MSAYEWSRVFTVNRETLFYKPFTLAQGLKQGMEENKQIYQR